MTIKSFITFLEEEKYTEAKEAFESALAEKISAKLEAKKVEFGKKISKENLEKDSDDPCWDGYVQLGTKMKDGKEVPNCVPMEEIKNQLGESIKVSGYYRKDPKVTSNVDKLNRNSSLEELIHAYLEAAKIVSDFDYGSTEYDFADSDMEYLSSILSQKGISTRDLNKLFQRFEKDGKYPVIKESVNESTTVEG